MNVAVCGRAVHCSVARSLITSGAAVSAEQIGMKDGTAAQNPCNFFLLNPVLF